MKKIVTIGNLFLIITLIVANSLFTFTLVINRVQIRYSKSEHFSLNNYFDFDTRCLYVSNESYKWIDDEELSIDGNYYDVLKIVDLGNGKSRIYIYSDHLETHATNTLNNDHLGQNTGSKKQNISFNDLLKLKTYTKKFSLITSNNVHDLDFGSLSMNTQEGHFQLPYHPPTV